MLRAGLYAVNYGHRVALVEGDGGMEDRGGGADSSEDGCDQHSGAHLCKDL